MAHEDKDYMRKLEIKQKRNFMIIFYQQLGAVAQLEHVLALLLAFVLLRSRQRAISLRAGVIKDKHFHRDVIHNIDLLQS